MNLRTIMVSAAALAMLSACGTRDKVEEGTSLTINAKDEGGNVAIRADGKTGKVSVNLPGFDANLKLPKMMLDHSNFDIDGVELYPGSKIRSVTVDADDTHGRDKAKVRVAFDAPAGTDKVQAWFKNGFEKENVTFSRTQTGFSGTTDDGDAFVVTLTPDGTEATSGVIDLTG